jgi:hypothetical protein
MRPRVDLCSSWLMLRLMLLMGLVTGTTTGLDLGRSWTWVIRVKRTQVVLSLFLASPTTGQYQLFASSAIKLMISLQIQVDQSSLNSAPSPSEATWQKGHVNKVKVGKASTSAKGRRGFVPPAPKQGPAAGREIIRTVPPLTPGGITSPAVCPTTQPGLRCRSTNRLSRPQI